MTRQLDQQVEERQDRLEKKLGRLVDYGFEGALSRAGAEMTGFSVKFGHDDCLMIIRAVVAGNHVVCFVGAVSLASCLIRAANEASRDALSWRVDKFKVQSPS